MIPEIIKFLILGGLGTLMVVLTVMRLMLTLKNPVKNGVRKSWAYSQTTGNKEVQADCAEVSRSRAGLMAVLADGIGKENTGKVAAQIAVDTLLDAYEPYRRLNNPEYFFRSTFLEANNRIRQTIGERRGGACMGAVFTDGKELHYALVGNIRIALFRNGELIPLSKGHTLETLAHEAYQEGRLNKQDTIWSIGDTGTWNYLGKDNFKEIEIVSWPITLNPKDIIMMTSHGIQELSWVELEELLVKGTSIDEIAENIIKATDEKNTPDKENGSVVLLRPFIYY